MDGLVSKEKYLCFAGLVIIDVFLELVSAEPSHFFENGSIERRVKRHSLSLSLSLSLCACVCVLCFSFQFFSDVDVFPHQSSLAGCHCEADNTLCFSLHFRN